MKRISLSELRELLSEAYDYPFEEHDRDDEIDAVMDILERTAARYCEQCMAKFWKQSLEVGDDGSWMITTPAIPSQPIQCAGEELPDIVGLLAYIEKEYNLKLGQIM